MIKRNVLLAAAGALALSGLATGAFASTLSASATSTVIVVSPTTLTKNQDLNFGTVVRPSGTSANTTFTLDPVTGLVTKGTAGDGSVVASTTTAAVFTLQTIAAITYSPVATLTFAPAGQLINIAPSAPVVASTTGGTASTVPASGAVTLTYGGRFDVTSTTVPQTYTGALAVTVTYN
jgi:Domain of unknown function (DUF4402)